MTVSFGPLIQAVVRDVGRGLPAATISARFHESLAALILRVAERARKAHGAHTVVLTGGVFLNKRLLERTEERLLSAKFRVLRPLAYSPSDESLSVGQIAWGLARLAKNRKID